MVSSKLYLYKQYKKQLRQKWITWVACSQSQCESLNNTHSFFLFDDMKDTIEKWLCIQALPSKIFLLCFCFQFSFPMSPHMGFQHSLLFLGLLLPRPPSTSLPHSHFWFSFSEQLGQARPVKGSVDHVFTLCRMLWIAILPLLSIKDLHILQLPTNKPPVQSICKNLIQECKSFSLSWLDWIWKSHSQFFPNY